MDFDWSVEHFTSDNELLPADALDRAKYAEYLTHFLVGKGHTHKDNPNSGHYVLNLNAEWGAGKSYFLKRWAEDLKQHYPVVYIDAWQQDYSDDPLLTAVSAMINQLRVQAGKDADKTIFKAPRKMLGLLKAAAPAAIAGIVKRYAGFDFQEIMQAADDALGTVTDEHTGKEIDLSKAASAMVKSLLDDHDAKAQAIQALKEQVKQWVGAVVGLNGQSEHPKNYPAFILVDELDRCRPSYAVEMLETIKHIFDIPRVVFVVATDTEQLQHTVKALYGEGFDAHAYLGRFFNSRYTLKTPSLEKLLPVHCEVHKLSKEYLEGRGIISWPDLDYPPEANDLPEKGNLKNLIAVFDAYKLNARLALQVTERLICSIDSLKPSQHINLVYLAFLMCLREANYPLFKAFLNNKNLSGNFRYESRPISIDETLRELLDLSDKKIIIHLAPSQIVPVFTPENTGDRYFNRRFNEYCKMNYQGNLSEFINRVHPYIFSLNAQKDIDQCMRNLGQNKNQGQSTSDARLFGSWVSIYTSFNRNNNHTIDFYKDLVELSACLDSGDAE
ncbi:hypothetical protein HR45_17380 [Shewanella mangrovi]|uniref:KAP NTPase domain-containing protein n=1 Tax=Shewanella mangrovi TaxID=1515746 RepID=A0A094J8L8_9GAMM|nr:P-loop NTPase fold protein [Shewanella mangrovi]KFZ36275.1 hypothetical protein HR45_17380 [Shewanella mangrovi]